MMKKLWLVLLAVVLVFGLGLLGCSDSSSGDDDDDDGGGDGELVIDNPVFEGWGGLGGTESNTFTMDTAVANNRATYTIPEAAKSFTNLKLEYTLTKNQGENLPMKITIKDSLKNNWGNTENDEYKQSDTNGNMTYTAKVSKFTTGAITVAHNTYNNESSSFVIKFTKITFSNE